MGPLNRLLVEEKDQKKGVGKEGQQIILTGLSVDVGKSTHVDTR